MARNYKPRSASSASNNKGHQPERAHVRAPRQVRPHTPRVFDSSPKPEVSPRGTHALHQKTDGAPRQAAHAAGPSGNARATSTSRDASSGALGTRGRTQTPSGQREPRSSATRGGASRSGGHRTSRRSAGSGSTRSAHTRNARGGERRKTAPSQERRVPRQRGGAGSKILLLLVLVVVLAGGFTAVYFSSLFTITNVRVSGNEKLMSSYVLALAEVPADSTFLRIDADGIRARVLAEPWIKSVDIERSFPDTLTLKVTEQPIAAVVDIVPESATASAKRWVIAEDGTWIAEITDYTGEAAANGGTATAGGTAESAHEGAAEGATTDETTPAGEDPAGDASAGTDAGAGTSNEGAGAASGAGEDAGSGTAEGEQASSPEGEGTATGSGDATAASDGEGAQSSAHVQLNAEELVKIPKIRDISAAVRPEAGVKETDLGITNGLALLTGFSPEMRAMVASISAPDDIKTMLTLYNNVGVAFGKAEDIEAKEQAIATLLAEHEGTITFINVRVADRASYRATE